MADLVITPADVLVSSPNKSERGVAATAISAGDVVYKDTSAENRLRLAQCDGTDEEANVAGIAVNNAATLQPINFVSAGALELTITAGATQGIKYVLSVTPGKIMPEADLVSTNRIVELAVGSSTTILRLDIEVTGITKP